MPENFIASLESNSPAPAPAEPAAPSSSPAPAETPESNVPAEPATPAETPTPDVTPTEPAPTEPKLYDLPDGRKVDAATLAREFHEKFLPDYTRKAQELSRLKSQKPINNPETPTEQPKPTDNAKPWEDPNWQPKDWGEVISIAERQAYERLTSSEKEALERQSMVEAYVNAQLDEVKALDPKVDEGQLFAHAQKYGFDNLKNAFINMKEMQQVRIQAEQNALKNINTRKAEPISTGSAPKVDDDSIDPAITNRFSSATEAFRFFKK